MKYPQRLIGAFVPACVLVALVLLLIAPGLFLYSAVAQSWPGVFGAAVGLLFASRILARLWAAGEKATTADRLSSLVQKMALANAATMEKPS